VCNSSGALYVLPPLPSFRVLLGYAVIGRVTVRKDDVSSVTSRAIHVAFSACQITALIGETDGCAGVVVAVVVEV
jgi:hypothetical protein